MKPTERNTALLQDMLTACREILEFARGVGLEHFVANPQLCRAVERCLEIVGEAAGRLSPELVQSHPEIPWQEIRGLRNILAHEYAQIDYEILHRTIQEDVPMLAIQLMRILAAGPAAPSVEERRAVYDVIIPVSSYRGGFAPGIEISNAGFQKLMDDEDVEKCLRLAGWKLP
jgi:uncharacterized protein with HEPN domain